MITIFCDFCQFYAKKLAFKKSCDPFFAEFRSVLSQKTPIFSPVFLAKIFFNNNVGRVGLPTARNVPSTTAGWISAAQQIKRD
jgi:hypothetical protein